VSSGGSSDYATLANVLNSRNIANVLIGTLTREANVMTIAVIANNPHDLYAANTMPKKTAATPEQLIDLEKRVKAGEWLRMGDAALLLDVSRTKMHTLVSQGVVGYRVEAGGRWRKCNPRDIKKLLAESRRELRAAAESNIEDHADPSS
jgi:hypothetical protein